MPLVGWSAGFPAGPPDPNVLPKPWVDALNAAVQAGKIPNIPPSIGSPGQNPKYPDGINPNDPNICSSTYKCRIQGDHWDAPDGVFASSFDDGPYPVRLYVIVWQLFRLNLSLVDIRSASRVLTAQ